MKNSGGIHIGTSGWNYAHWQGPFYPEEGISAYKNRTSPSVCMI